MFHEAEVLPDDSPAFLTAFVGDTHANLKTMWSYFVDWQDRTEMELKWLWQVGDFGIWPDSERIDRMTRKHAELVRFDVTQDITDCLLGEYQIPIPTYFTRGNHEDQEFLRLHERRHMSVFPEDFYTRPIEICPNLFYVPDSYVVTVDGIRIASWGGCWGGSVWDRNIPYWPTPGNEEHEKYRRGRYLNHMCRDSFETLMRSEFDVLVTHDAPTGAGVKGPNNPETFLAADEIRDHAPEGQGVPAIRELIEAKQPAFQFNGHWHQHHHNKIGRTTSIVLDQFAPEKIHEKRFVEYVEF